MKRSTSKHRTALLIIDMINPLEFSEGKKLLKSAMPAARQTAKLADRARKARIPVIFVNDNFGKWQSDWKRIYDYASRPESLGAPMAKILVPQEDDYFILKPRHSGFFQTNLDALLQDLKVQHLVLTGIAGNMCVLFTANDAHMRNFKVTIPRDCIASNTKRDDLYTLTHLTDVLGLRTPLSASVRF